MRLKFDFIPDDTCRRYGKNATLSVANIPLRKLVDEDAPLSEVLPNVYNANKARYKDYTIRQLCQEMHNLYVSHDVKQLQKEMFRKAHFPTKVMDPQEANLEFIRGKVELVPLSQIEGRIAAEGALPYPPGVLCMVPGEIWEVLYSVIS